LILVVHPVLPVKTLRELIALAKSRPRELNFGSAGSGSSPHMALELLREMAGIEVNHVPYKGTTPAITDLLGGHIQLFFSGYAACVAAGARRQAARARGDRRQAHVAHAEPADRRRIGTARFRDRQLARHGAARK
jgi:tripartite-type tricarboxylate transporter receptor subunit TctC